MLTACTRPPRTVPNLVVSDWKVREGQYLESFRRWGSIIPNDDAVYIIDNSGHDYGIAAKSAFKRQRTMAMSYNEDADVFAAGKGVGEARMFDVLADHIREDAGHPSSIVKVTGRLWVPNALTALGSAPQSEEANAGQLMCRISEDLLQVDTRFMAFNYQALVQYLTNISAGVREKDGVFLEHAVAAKLRAHAGEGLTRLGFVAAPLILGASGSTGAGYGGKRARIRSWLSPLINRLNDRYF